MEKLPSSTHLGVSCETQKVNSGSFARLANIFVPCPRWGVWRTDLAPFTSFSFFCLCSPRPLISFRRLTLHILSYNWHSQLIFYINGYYLRNVHDKNIFLISIIYNSSKCFLLKYMIRCESAVEMIMRTLTSMLISEIKHYVPHWNLSLL